VAADNVSNMKKIFVIDDYNDDLTLMQNALTGAGYNVHCFNTCLSAYDRVNDLKPDLIVTDVFLEFGASSGLASIVHFRKSFPDLPIVAVSGYKKYLDMVEYLDLDVSFTFEKSMSYEKLVKKIDELFKGADA